MFQYKRCPFGLTNAPSVFQRAMNKIFYEGLYERCVVYIDDILVYAKTELELCRNLRWVFTKCELYGVKLKLSKCQFMKRQVEFLGFSVTHNHIAPIPGKCDPIGQKNPTNKRDVLSILGTMNYYSRFIERFSEKTRPLRDLTRKDVPFIWSDELALIISGLQADLEKAMPQIIPESASPKLLKIYILKYSIEVSCYTIEDELISRTGCTLSSSQMNYTQVEKNLLALILAYEKFGPFLRGDVTISTTCKQLETTLKLKEQPERISRLLLQLPPNVDMDFKIQLRKEDL